MAKPKEVTDLYLINTPVEDLLDNEQISFKGESERDRHISVMKFTRVRNILIRYSQAFSKDEFNDLMEFLKQFVVIKKE